jgi:hypothetical protein
MRKTLFQFLRHALGTIKGLNRKASTRARQQNNKQKVRFSISYLIQNRVCRMPGNPAIRCSDISSTFEQSGEDSKQSLESQFLAVRALEAGTYSRM